MNLDLTAEEQDRVRVAMRYFRSQLHGWDAFGRVIHYAGRTLGNVSEGACPVTPALAFKVARLAGIGMNELLAGEFPPPGTCPRCGYCATVDKEDK